MDEIINSFKWLSILGIPTNKSNEYSKSFVYIEDLIKEGRTFEFIGYDCWKGHPVYIETFKDDE